VDDRLVTPSPRYVYRTCSATQGSAMLQRVNANRRGFQSSTTQGVTKLQDTNTNSTHQSNPRFEILGTCCVKTITLPWMSSRLQTAREAFLQKAAALLQLFQRRQFLSGVASLQTTRPASGCLGRIPVDNLAWQFGLAMQTSAYPHWFAAPLQSAVCHRSAEDVARISDRISWMEILVINLGFFFEGKLPRQLY
jgi:hypothetical protein